MSFQVVVNKTVNQSCKVCQWQCSATEITWSNQRRKRRQQKLQSNICDSSETNKTTLQENTQDVTQNKLASTTDIDHNQKIHEDLSIDNASPSDSKVVCTFEVCLQENDKDELDIFVQCITAENKNHVYQFYQFLHNKIIKGL